MSNKHTPGPWRANAKHLSCTNDAQIAIEQEGGSAPVAKVFQIYGDQMQANARLIAAAPDLMEAIVRLEFAAQCRDNTMGDPCRLIAVKAELAAAAAQARAAIAKATGA